jgi:glycosyltransferase involved in cell wall biosynthesis
LPRAPAIAKARVLAHQPRLARARSREEIHIAVASLVRGGAERIVLDTCRALARSGRRVHLIVLHRRADEYPVPAGVRLSRIGRAPDRSIDEVAREIARSGVRVLLAHLLRTSTLERFWRRGVTTIPVIHNMSERWIEDPSSYRRPLVPYVIAVSAAVARDLKARCAGIGVTVLRHDLAGRSVHAEDGARALLRGKMDLKRGTLLIGMVGNFKLHKGYPRALRVLAEVLRVRDARLLIAGGAADHEGRTALQAARDLAKRLALEGHVLFAGPVARIEPLLAAFDVYLSTSLFEGLSVAALEARAAGLPLVLSTGGGQEELAGPNVTLLPPPFEPKAFAAAVVAAGEARREPPVIRAVSHRLWALHARGASARGKCSERIAFVTANLNAGGAQRSLVHLLRAMHADFQVSLCVTQQSTSRYFLDRLQRAGVPVFRPRASTHAFDAAEGLLDSFAGSLPRIVCFWNADPRLKLLLVKALEHARVCVVDVSPGPSMYAELDAVEEFQHAIAFGAQEYFGRLDALVVKYAAGLGQARARAPMTRVALIPNGVPVPRASRTAHAPNLIAAGRLAPTKHLELLPAVIRRIRAARPHCQLDVAGQAEPRHHDWLDRVWTKMRRASGVRLVGPLPDFPSRVSGYAALLLASEQQGCPNTSLEALAAGVPVIANDDGGTGEQVIDGETGYLLPRIDPKRYAACALRILEDPSLRARLGANGREHVMRNFSIARMRERYRDLFYELLERGEGSQTSTQTYVPNANVASAIASDGTTHQGETPGVAGLRPQSIHVLATAATTEGASAISKSELPT